MYESPFTPALCGDGTWPGLLEGTVQAPDELCLWVWGLRALQKACGSYLLPSKKTEFYCNSDSGFDRTVDLMWLMSVCRTTLASLTLPWTLGLWRGPLRRTAMKTPWSSAKTYVWYLPTLKPSRQTNAQRYFRSFISKPYKWFQCKKKPTLIKNLLSWFFISNLTLVRFWIVINLVTRTWCQIGVLYIFLSPLSPDLQYDFAALCILRRANQNNHIAIQNCRQEQREAPPQPEVPKEASAPRVCCTQHWHHKVGLTSTAHRPHWA